MRRIATLLFLTCLMLLLAGQTFAAPQQALQQALQQERRVALIIGNGAYSASPLKNPANDARDMASALKSVGFEVILRENASLRQMNEAIDQFWGSLKKGGVGLFFFAGHGLQVAGDNYLVPVDAKIALEKDVQYECVNAGKVLGRMEDAGNGLNIVILDACRNNPFARSFRSDSRGLAKMDAPSGSLVAFATAPGDVAADGHGKNGLYTSHLLRHLRTPGLTIEKVLKQTRIGVAADSAQVGKKQTPWESSSLMGDFYFIPAGGQTPAQAPAQSVGQTASLPPAPQPAPRPNRVEQPSGGLDQQQTASPASGRRRPAEAASVQAQSQELTGLTVRLIYTDDMKDTADKVERTLREQGMSVQMLFFKKNDSYHGHIRKLYSAKGYEVQAGRISELIRPHETVSIVPGNTAMGDGQQFNLWIAR